MLTRQLPKYINVRKLVDRGAVLDGVVDLSRFERFSQALSAADGQVAVKLVFFQGARGQRLIEGRAEVDVKQQCQRCLGDMESSVSVDVSLIIATDPDKTSESVSLPRPPKPGQVQGSESVVYEPLLLVDPEEDIDLVEIIEDDMVLALPMIPFHEIEVCQELGYTADFGDSKTPDSMVNEAPVSEQERENPFAVLEQLKFKQSKKDRQQD